MHDQVEEVKQKTDIVAVISEHVKLTHAGKHYKGLCPFHSEKTPSFTVSPEMQIYKCFGCGEGGDVFTFLEKYEGMDFAEALRFLAEKAGVVLTAQPRTQSAERDRLIAINQLAAAFYHYLLTKHPSGRGALEYVTKTRGLTADTIKTFQIGFAPANPRSLISFLLKKKYSYQELEKAGVASYQKDRFRNRVIFPLFDHRGNCVGLAGRIMPTETNKNVGKYINSPETPIYHKSEMLYGLNVTRGFIKQADVAVIVEGELDAISSFQSGVKNVVAIKGSALTEGQLRILSRLTSVIILALDSDMAGDSAARRGIVIAQSLGMNIRVMQSDIYKDPDEFARADVAGYKKALKNAVGVWDFIIDSVIKKHGIGSGEGKAKVSRELVPILATIPDEIVQAHYVGQLAQKLDVPFDAVKQQIVKVEQPKKQEQNNADIQPLAKRTRQESIFALILQSKDPSIVLTDAIRPLFSESFSQRLIEHLEIFLQTKQWSVAGFVASLPAELKTKVEEMVLTEDEELSLQEIENSLKSLRDSEIRSKIDSLAKKIAEYEQNDDPALFEAEKELARLTRLLSTNFRV